MALDPTIRRTITETVKSFISEGKMFTAFEVSLAVKAQGVRERHRNMKELVHEIIFEIGGPENYTRTLMDVGAPEQAWLYHRPRDNPYRYVPLPRGDEPASVINDDEMDTPVELPDGIRRPIQLVSSKQPAEAIPRGAYGTDQRGRLCIPVTFLARLGVGPGETVAVFGNKDQETLEIQRTEDSAESDADATYTVEPDGNVRITQTTLEKAGIEHLPCYHIDGTASKIAIRAFAW